MTRRLVSTVGKAAFALGLVGSSGAAWAQTVSETRVADSNGDGMDTHLFRPAVDSKGFFSVNGSDILGKGDISFGLVLDYGRNLMRTRSDSTPTDAAGQPCVDETCMGVMGNGTGVPALVQNSFQGTFGFNYGVANLAVVGVSIPVILMTGDAAYQIGPNGALYNSQNLDAQRISGLVLHGKYRLTRVDRTIGLGAVLQAGIPLGAGAKDLGADPGAWFWPQLIVENRFGSTGRFRVALNAGYRLHTGENPRFESKPNGGPMQLEEGRFQYGNLGTFGVGLSLRALDALDIVAETYGSYITGGDSDSKQKLSQEIVGGIKLFIEQNSYLLMGAGSRAFSTGFEAADVRLILGFVFEPSIGDRDGDGYKDDQDACPDEPEDFDGFQDGDGCPEPDNDNDGILDVDDRCPNVPEDRDGDQDEDGCPEGKLDGDRDGDGIPDSKDKCPDVPEDRDGFQDDDGCPEADNDKDGIPDSSDQCPNDAEDRDKFEDDDGCPDPDNDKDQIPDSKDKCPNDPETYNGYQDADGCPDKGKVVIEGNDIIIFEKVQFETNSAKILPASNEILNAVAAVLKGHPEFQQVEVGGHADERGSDEHNLRLTKARAASVMEALRSRGIATSRLLSQGYGEYCPLDDHSNPAAWDKNRRVEFKVVKTEEGETGVKRGCETARSKGIYPPK
ncbi:MAG TPA: OmpA family protein [Polyangiaceae bacterium]|nr:OmpA family protein [Polyangiaceae bacterium]